MIEKIKLKKIKTNHYVDQNNDLFLIVKNNENNYDFLYLELIMMDNLENKELKFDSEIEVVNYLESRDINDFQKEVFKNYLVSIKKTITICSEPYFGDTHKKTVD